MAKGGPRFTSPSKTTATTNNKTKPTCLVAHVEVSLDSAAVHPSSKSFGLSKLFLWTLPGIGDGGRDSVNLE